MKTYIIAYAILLSLMISFIWWQNIQTQNHLKDIEEMYIKRFEPLIQDSLKMHSWYRNWQKEYQFKNFSK